MFYCHLKATPFVQKLRKEMKKKIGVALLLLLLPRPHQHPKWS